MKLIDLLVHKTQSGDFTWPSDAERVIQLATGIIYIDSIYGLGRELIECKEVSEDARTTSVTRAQYEAALEASQKVEWNGKGLPPVGTKCEHHAFDGTVTTVEIIAHFQNNAAMVAAFIPVENKYKLVSQAIAERFRPIRSESDKKRKETIDLMDKRFKATLASGSTEAMAIFAAVYDTIAAGKMPGDKIDG